ncbi:MAG: response regulator [Candidatus Sabulitectum sp.]|nr:response regulator [Candidatus Sabulitectum sp.]
MVPRKSEKARKQLISEIEELRGSISILESDKQMLERPGFNALTAPHGRNAVKLFRKHSEDIVPVILDLIMPHLDGEETFRKLQLIRKNVRVVMCSGYNEQEVTRQFAGRSLAGFLHKPYMFNDLETVIKKVLEKQA